jgi:uncharacterized membrane protein YdfJ with MMPL/SSD domain
VERIAGILMEQNGGKDVTTIIAGAIFVVPQAAKYAKLLAVCIHHCRKALPLLFTLLQAERLLLCNIDESESTVTAGSIVQSLDSKADMIQMKADMEQMKADMKQMKAYIEWMQADMKQVIGQMIANQKAMTATQEAMTAIQEAMTANQEAMIKQIATNQATLQKLEELPLSNNASKRPKEIEAAPLPRSWWCCRS